MLSMVSPEARSTARSRQFSARARSRPVIGQQGVDGRRGVLFTDFLNCLAYFSTKKSARRRMSLPLSLRGGGRGEDIDAVE
jgi:hypothetical protein